MFYIGVLYRENMKKILLSETTRPSWLIFGLWHHLVDLYQVCSNTAPGAKNGPSPRVITYFISAYKRKLWKNLLV